MTLTHRQRTFLHRLLDVYPDHRDEPVHYSTVAQALGVSNTTAYEMMKLLEKKGYKYLNGYRHTIWGLITKGQMEMF